MTFREALNGYFYYNVSLFEKVLENGSFAEQIKRLYEVLAMTRMVALSCLISASESKNANVDSAPWFSLT